MKYIYQSSLIFCIVLLASCSKSQTASKSSQPSTFAFYNVENLFDTEDDPSIIDEEFMPESNKKWTLARYNTKLEKLSTVISQLGDKDGPEMLGVSEVENKKVLDDLITTPKLKEMNYKIVHENSPDARGIDVAFLYKESDFKLISYSYHRVKFEGEYESTKTRDFLYVRGMHKGDTVHVIVNHWPSRRGGMEKSEPKRMFVASKVRNLIDSLKLDQKNLIITGDFNDMPTNNSIMKGLQAGNDNTFATFNLYNTLHQNYLDGQGSYNYKNEWNMLDQLIVSKKMYKNIILQGSQNVFSPEWIKQHGDKYEGYPDRTYAGRKYLGGYSDHFPVYIHFK